MEWIDGGKRKEPLIEAKSDEKLMILGVGERARLGRKAFVVMNGPYYCSPASRVRLSSEEKSIRICRRTMRSYYHDIYSEFIH